MNTIKLDCCKSCNNVFDAKLCTNKQGDQYFMTVCDFCTKREKKIKRIKQQILDLEWKLFLMKA